MLKKELKRRFVQEQYEKESTRNTALVALNKPRKMEEELNKDFCEFTKEEIISFFQRPESGSYYTLEMSLPYYRLYAKFASKELGIQNDYLMNVTLNDLKELSAEKIEKEKSRALSRKEILDICSLLNNPRDQVILLGSFEGISISDPNEFLEIRPEDVHEDYVYIPSRNYKLKISDELAKYFKEAMKAETYEYFGLVREKKINLIKGDEVAIKILEDVDPDRSIRVTLKKITSLVEGEYKGFLTIPNLKYSGIANKVVEFMDDRQIPLNTAYKICRPILMQEFGIDRLSKPKILGLAEYLLKEREKKNG